jgi:hypothetical protein
MAHPVEPSPAPPRPNWHRRIWLIVSSGLWAVLLIVLTIGRNDFHRHFTELFGPYLPAWLTARLFMGGTAAILTGFYLWWFRDPLRRLGRRLRAAYRALRSPVPPMGTLPLVDRMVADVEAAVAAQKERGQLRLANAHLLAEIEKARADAARSEWWRNYDVERPNVQDLSDAELDKARTEVARFGSVLSDLARALLDVTEELLHSLQSPVGYLARAPFTTTPLARCFAC